MTIRRIALASSLVLAVLAASGVASAQGDDTTIQVTGHGWGHGRGMGQYGSLGYAIDHGWSSPQMLDHYYGDTTAGSVPNDVLTIRLDSANDQPTVAGVDDGAMVLLGADGAVTHIGKGGAVRLTSVAGGFVIADAPDCAGPFVDRPGILESAAVRISTASTEPSGGKANLPAGRIVVGDWDGDGDDDLGAVAGDTWRLWFDGPTSGQAADITVTLTAGDTVFAADWDGDGVDTPSSFSVGSWSWLNGLSVGASTSTASFGASDDVPFAGDWDGDGSDNFGVRRGSTWLFDLDGGGNAEVSTSYGRATDGPIIGDWDGDGTDDLGVIRNRRWFRRIGLASTTEHLAEVAYVNSSEALVGDWDGNGIDQSGSFNNGAADLTGPMNHLVARNEPELPLAATIHRCESAGVQRFYRGELRAVANSGRQRTVNAVEVESYLRAVVPQEMPASWASIDGGVGAAALETQAVSARSYSLAENRTSYARTCDTISCQVYGGRAVRRQGTVTSNEHPLSDAALLSTAGVVRMRSGDVARTEFSSSTGGWTAGGVFPSVEDAGDAVDRNPNHDWSVQLELSRIERWFSDRTLTSVSVTERNGLGEDGGRVEEVTFVFGDEVFTQTGDEFRRAFGLKSNWFTIDWSLETRRTDCICPEDWPAPELFD